MEMNLENLPKEIINKIMTYNSHPLSDLFKKSECYTIHKFNFDVEDFSLYWQDIYRPMIGKHKSYKEW